ncbi:MAG: abortive infection family protein [bacterium]
MKISEATRRDIFDSLLVENISWAGHLEEADFLSRIFDLQSLPSEDYRCNDAYGDIWQHRVNNPDDWKNDWVFNDHRFNLLHCDDELFLRFLCETIHPVVRSNIEDVERLRQNYNHLLQNNGYEIVERTKIAGRPVFVARQIQLKTQVPISSLKERFAEGDSSYVARQITRMESSIYEDPGLAIGTSKELIETICKTILKEHNIPIEGNPDLPQLVKLTAKELKLTPDDIPDSAKASDTIKKLLSNLSTITNGIAELRNKYGTGHGKDVTTKGLGPRHAKLSVGAASTLAVFLIETHEERR